MRIRHALLSGLLGLFLLPLAARAQTEYQLSQETRDKLVVVSDGKGHFVAAVPDTSADENLFYGDGKRFYVVPVQGSGAESGKSFEYYFVDPRFGPAAERTVEWQGGKYRVRCGQHATELNPLAAGEARSLLQGARFLMSPRKWAAYALARDSRGRYYYVDHGRSPETAKNFRFWVGPRGGLKQQKMINVVSDSEGDIFATRSGSLRLILSKREGSWVAGERTTLLTLVPVEDNVQLIYNELGIYAGETMGTPCDDL